MMPLLFLAAASADLNALDQAVARCDRAAANPAFAGESARRSEFLLKAYREQEAIVAARADLSARRREWRESTRPSASDDKALRLEEAALEDRQKALNDQRMLEAIRQDAMDNMRRYFLMNCPAGKDGHNNVGH
jgi:hypothetical protein